MHPPNVGSAGCQQCAKSSLVYVCAPPLAPPPGPTGQDFGPQTCSAVQMQGQMMELGMRGRRHSLHRHNADQMLDVQVLVRKRGSLDGMQMPPKTG